MIVAQILMSSLKETKPDKTASKTHIELTEGLARIVTYVTKWYILKYLKIRLLVNVQDTGRHLER